MTYFEQALRNPESHFSRLCTIKPVYHNGKLVIRRTHCAVEAEVEWNERRYLLMLPFREESLRHIEELEQQSRERSCGPLIENRVLHNELTLINARGQKEQFDIILQEISYGIPLSQAILHYKAEDLRRAVERMKSRIDAIGFRHNNLSPSNILICKSGTARPLRYWYAEWFDFTNNDISAILKLIEQSREIGTTPLLAPEDDESDEYQEHEGIRVVRKHNKYGFVDRDGRLVAPYIYSSATPFREGRAIVCKNNKMGAIDHNGAKIISVSYKTLSFDIETGTFSASRDGYNYTLDYNGKVICRWKSEGGGFLIAENGNQKSED